MPEDNIATTPSIPPVDPSIASTTPASDVVSAPEPTIPESPVPTAPESTPTTLTNDTDGSIRTEVANKIRDSKNVLIALSSDPSVDEMAAAIGLSLYLDKLGKRATAIYSGTTPNALEFLKPEETFESTADTLQDFVIALSKDKADHLRYKLDGDYVKIYITPYKTRISEDDLEFSYGDFNVDLVLALDVSNGIDLDSALREHGRIMHDAVIVNITTGNPGKFGEIEWSDKSASSVSEMIANLLYSASSNVKIGKEEATAFLTGIVAATNRFSNASTTPDTMQISSKLMESGANQQLVSKNITPDVENEMFSLSAAKTTIPSEGDPTNLDIEHHGEDGTDEASTDESSAGDTKDSESAESSTKESEPDNSDSKEVNATITEKNSTLLDDLKAAEASLSQAGAETTPEASKTSVKIDSAGNTSNIDEITAPSAEASISEPASTAQAPEPDIPTINSAPEKTLQPSAEFGSQSLTLEDENKYGKMLEDALDSINANPTTTESISTPESTPNPATAAAPTVPTAPEINGVPEMNYMPMPDEEILPPPPAPPIDMSTAMPSATTPAIPSVEPITPAAPTGEPTPEPLGSQPAMQDQVYAPQASDPSAFKIPGM